VSVPSQRTPPARDMSACRWLGLSRLRTSPNSECIRISRAAACDPWMSLIPRFAADERFDVTPGSYCGASPWMEG
jgi:hypothetical protein